MRRKYVILVLLVGGAITVGGEGWSYWWMDGASFTYLPGSYFIIAAEHGTGMFYSMKDGPMDGKVVHLFHNPENWRQVTIGGWGGFSYRMNVGQGIEVHVPLWVIAVP